MMNTQVRKISIVAALLAATAMGCSKDKGSGAGGAASAATKGALQMMPKDADIVMGIDFANLRSSDLYKQYAPMLMSAAGDKLAKFKDTCGFDPVESIGTVTVAMKGAKGDQDITFVVNGFKKDQLIDCIKKAADKEGKKVTVDGDYVSMDGPKGPFGMLFVGDSILFHKLPDDTSATKDQLIAQSKQGADASPTSSATFNDAFGKVDGKASLWFVVNGNAPQMKASPLQFKVAAVSLKVTDGLAADVTATMNSEADAKQVVDMAKAQLDQIKGTFVSDANAEAKGADVHITVAMSKDQLQSLAGMAKGMLRGMGGGMGGGGMGSP